MKLLVGGGDKSKHVFCHLCQCKVLEDGRIVDKVMRSISDKENTKIVLKTDGEPALVQLQDRINSVRTQPTIPGNPHAYETQTNGGAVRGQEVKKTIEGNQCGTGGQNSLRDHGDHGHLRVDDPAGRGYDQPVLVW